jgi:hypothetical protein
MINRIELLASASGAALQTGDKRSKRETENRTKPKPSNRKPPPRYAKLDGKPLARPRGRHAVARSDTSDDDAAKRETITIPSTQRLGFRVAEFAALTGVSVVTVWRGIKRGKVETIDHLGITIIPRSFAIKRGFITADDNV